MILARCFRSPSVRLVVVALTGIQAAPIPGQAGVITFIGPPDNANLPTPFPGNDDNPATQANNPVVLSKTFTSLDPIDREFTVENFNATTEYFFTDTVLNSTGSTWLDFHLQLGFGTGAAFVASGPGDDLDFDTPNKAPGPHSTKFANPPLHGNDNLAWAGGAGVPPGESVVFTFSVDVPDNGSIPEDFKTANGYKFTLRQFPTITGRVPDSGSHLMLLAMCGLGLIGCGRWLER